MRERERAKGGEDVKVDQRLKAVKGIREDKTRRNSGKANWKKVRDSRLKGGMCVTVIAGLEGEHGRCDMRHDRSWKEAPARHMGSGARIKGDVRG